MAQSSELRTEKNNPGAIDCLVMYLGALFYIVYAGLLFRKLLGSSGSMLFTVGLGFFPLLVAYFSGYSLKPVFRFRRPALKEIAGGLLISAGLFLIVFFGSGLVVVLFPEVANRGSELQDFMIKSNIVVAIISVSILPAVCEELLFRGYILSGLKDSAGKNGSIILCGCLFGFLHLEPFQIPFTAIIGIGLAYVAWETRSIFVPIIMHACHNLALLLIARNAASQAPADPAAAIKVMKEGFANGSLYTAVFLFCLLLLSVALLASAVFLLYLGSLLLKKKSIPSVIVAGETEKDSVQEKNELPKEL